MLNSVTIAFLLGIFIGFFTAYFMRDVIKLILKWWRNTIFQPRYLSKHTHDEQNKK